MFGRIQLYIFGAIILFGVMSGFYYSWRRNIEREALLQYNQAQIEQNVKDQQAMREKLQAMEKKQQEIEAQNTADKETFKNKMESINKDIDSNNSKEKDKPSSDILKRTISQLKDAPK